MLFGVLASAFACAVSADAAPDVLQPVVIKAVAPDGTTELTLSGGFSSGKGVKTKHGVIPANSKAARLSERVERKFKAFQSEDAPGIVTTRSIVGGVGGTYRRIVYLVKNTGDKPMRIEDIGFLRDWAPDGVFDGVRSGNTDGSVAIFPSKRVFVGVEHPMAKLTVENGAFAWRKGILARDVDGDGVCELLAVNAEQEFCWYKQAGSPTRVREWRKLRFDDGKVITSNDIPPRQFPNPAAAFDFADWSGTGICDLFVSTNFRVTRLAGCGREMTVFRRPEFVDLPDGPLYLGLHENQAAFADIDADGVPEMLVGAESGLIHVFHRDYITGAVSRAAVRMRKNAEKASDLA